jgi:hypothetical protein
MAPQNIVQDISTWTSLGVSRSPTYPPFYEHNHVPCCLLCIPWCVYDMIYDRWQMTYIYMIYHIWHVICDMWYMIYDIWCYMTWHDMTHHDMYTWCTAYMFVSIHIMVGFIPPCLLLTCSIMYIYNIISYIYLISYIYIYLLYIYVWYIYMIYIYIYTYNNHIYIYILIYYICVFFPSST